MKVSAAETRKQLLIAESEVNRTLFLREWQAMTGEFRAAIQPVKEIGWMTSAIAVVSALFKALRPNSTKNAPSQRPSLFGRLLRLFLWFGLRRQSK